MTYIPNKASPKDYPKPSAMAAMLDHDNLVAAWLGVWKNRGGPGGDGVSLHYLAPDIHDHLARLSDAVHKRTYRPGPVRRVTVAKKSGGSRTLSIPCVIDRVAQKALALVLGPYFEAEFEDSSYAYRPGRSVDLAARQVTRHWQAGMEWVVDADIRAFFDNVPHAPLLLRFSDFVPEPPVVDLVAFWLQAAGDDPARSGELGAGRGLPQGAPMMPYLANFYLDQLDEELLMAGLRLVRYADDFLLFAPSREAAREGLVTARAHLEGMGLALNSDKTGIRHFADGFDFLGRRFSRSYLIDDPDGLDAEERLAVTRLADEAERVAVARGTAPPEPEPVRQIRGGWFDPPVPADMRAPEGDDAPFVLRTPEEEDARLGVPVAAEEGFRVLYLNTPGTVLDARHDSLAARQGGAEVWARVPEAISRVEIGPGIDVTGSAIRLAASRGLPLIWVAASGAPIARVAPPLADAAGLHLAQAAAALDPVRRLELSRSLAAGRVRSARSVIMGWKQNLARKQRGADGTVRVRIDAVLAAIAEEAGPLDDLSRRCMYAPDVETLRGFEADGVKRYWRVYRASVGAGMGTRSRPARDEVNATLNYLSALLQRDVETAALAAGLHPGIGIYHVTHDRADALVYDLMEEFRAPTSEALVNELFNQKALGAEDFVLSESGEVLISGAARGLLIRAWQSHVTRRNKGGGRGEKQSWRILMRAQSRAFVRALRQGTCYEPLRRGY